MSMGTDGGMLINHAALDQAAADLETGVKAIQARMTHLESDLKPLQSDWAGSAQQAYNVAKAKWDTAITEMQTLLTSTSQTVSQSNEDYRGADKRGAASFQI